MEQKKIWELQHTTICKVVGMAFGHSELKRMFRQFQLRVQNSRTDEEFAMHSAIVRMCEQENRISRHVHKLVEKKFFPYGKRLANRDMEAITNCVLRGIDDVGVPLWAIIWYLATREISDGANIQTALFGFIHMLEHRLVSSYWRESGTDHEVQEGKYRNELDALKKEIIRLQSANRELEKQNRTMALEKLQSCRCPDSCSPRVAAADCPKDNNHAVKIHGLKCLLEEERAKTGRLSEELLCVRRQMEALVLELASGESRDCSMIETAEDDDCACPLRRCLQGKTIAMVGGIDGLEPHYKSLVQESGGEFRRHNGHCRRGDRQLEELVKHADLVVCPISVNSHFGVVGVKRVCKRYGISCRFPESAGVGSLRNVLIEHFGSEQEMNM